MRSVTGTVEPCPTRDSRRPDRSGSAWPRHPSTDQRRARPATTSRGTPRAPPEPGRPRAPAGPASRPPAPSSAGPVRGPPRDDRKAATGRRISSGMGTCACWTCVPDSALIAYWIHSGHSCPSTSSDTGHDGRRAARARCPGSATPGEPGTSTQPDPRRDLGEDPEHPARRVPEPERRSPRRAAGGCCRGTAPARPAGRRGPTGTAARPARPRSPAARPTTATRKRRTTSRAARQGSNRRGDATGV